MNYFIVEAVNEKWISKIEDEVMDFTNKTSIKMLYHLETRWGWLEYANTNVIKKYRNATC